MILIDVSATDILYVCVLLLFVVNCLSVYAIY